MLKIAVNNQQSGVAIDKAQLREGVRRVLEGEGIASATISLAVVDDATMHRLNLQFLQHDYPTDVLSFLLEEDDQHLEGEIIVSADYASREATAFGWTPQAELLLYATHGALHLCGYDDQAPHLQAEMRAKEQAYLAMFGLTPRYDDDAHP